MSIFDKEGVKGTIYVLLAILIVAFLLYILPLKMTVTALTGMIITTILIPISGLPPVQIHIIDKYKISTYQLILIYFVIWLCISYAVYIPDIE